MYVHMFKSSAKHLAHLKCSRLVPWFQGQTKLTLSSITSNKESILLTLPLLAFNTPFQLWQSICTAPQRLESWNCSGLQGSQKTNKPTQQKNQTNKQKKTLWMAASYPGHWYDLLFGYTYSEQFWLLGKLQCYTYIHTYIAPAHAALLTLLESADLLHRYDMTMYHVLAVPASLTTSYINHKVLKGSICKLLQMCEGKPDI